MTDMNFEQARFNMIEQQIRPWQVLDQKVLDLLGKVPREDFVPAPCRTLAFVDMRIPIGHDQVMMTPKMEARLLQELAVTPDDKILEIGTGSGYMTALLASLGGHVYSVEIYPDLKEDADRKLAAHGIANVTLEVGDAGNGWDKDAPYDVIVLTGSVPALPDRLRSALAIGGRLVAIVGRSPAMETRIIRRVAEASWIDDSLFETDLPPLLNVEAPPRFVF